MEVCPKVKKGGEGGQMGNPGEASLNTLIDFAMHGWDPYDQLCSLNLKSTGHMLRTTAAVFRL